MSRVAIGALLAFTSCVEEVPLGPAPSDQTDCSFLGCGEACGFYLNEAYVTEIDGLPLVCANDGSCVPFTGSGCPSYDTCKEDDLVCGSACGLCASPPCEPDLERYCAPLGYCRYGAPVACE